MYKSHSSDRNLIQCVQCSLVSVKLFPCVPCRHSGKWRFSSTHTHTHTLNRSTTLSGHEWSALCQATPMSTEQESGWEPELARALWSKEKYLPLPGINTMMISCQTCGLLNTSTTLSQLCLITVPLKSVGCTVQLISLPQD